MINVKLAGAARTLLLPVRARAEEQARDASILEDPWSEDWYKHLPTHEDFEEWYNPAFQLATVIRSRLIDDMVTAFIDEHDNPLVVELGAGLSTRYFRVGEGKTRWVELDLPDAVVVRRKIDVEVKDHWFLPADFSDDPENWISLLPDVEPDNTLFIAEGVLMFSDEETVSTLFDNLNEYFPGATFIFDVVNPSYIERFMEDFEKMEAPMQWGIVDSDLSDLGVEVQNIAYLLTEYPERWQEIGVDNGALTEENSGYVVQALLK